MLCQMTNEDAVCQCDFCLGEFGAASALVGAYPLEDLEVSSGSAPIVFEWLCPTCGGLELLGGVAPIMGA